MRNTGYNIDGNGACVSHIEDENISANLIEEDLDQADLQLIDSFTSLKTHDRQEVMKLVKTMLDQHSKASVKKNF